jgi:hypothetical protein
MILSFPWRKDAFNPSKLKEPTIKVTTDTWRRNAIRFNFVIMSRAPLNI